MAAPGGLGIPQWDTVLVLAPFGVPESAATAASRLVTFSVVVWVVPLGLLGLWRQGSSTAELAAGVFGDEDRRAHPPGRCFQATTPKKIMNAASPSP